jgi:hypothetical protein
MRGTELAVTGPQWLELERAVGIENTAGETVIIGNQRVMNSSARCVL